MTERLIIGLGNPGPRFQGTRHNAGFLLIDRLIEKWRAVPQTPTVESLTWCAEPHGHRVTLMKPMTYMNLSGHALAAHVQKHPQLVKGLLIAYDDVALPLGRIRFRPSGSAGGQKGMAHIIEILETKDIQRLRLGVNGSRADGESLADFVLKPVPEEAQHTYQSMIESAAQAADFWLEESFENVMGRYNANPVEQAPLPLLPTAQSQLPGEEKVE